MREPFVSRTPPFYPGVCVGCGVQSHRRWYVEIGLDLDFHFNPMHEGNVIFCNECWNALVKNVNRVIKTFVEANKGKLDVVEADYEPRRIDPAPDDSNSEPTGNDQDIESSSSEDTELSTFRAHFANAR